MAEDTATDSTASDNVVSSSGSDWLSALGTFAGSALSAFVSNDNQTSGAGTPAAPQPANTAAVAVPGTTPSAAKPVSKIGQYLPIVGVGAAVVIVLVLVLRR